MTIRGRSLDDLPLAAYSTGAETDPRLEAPVAGSRAMAPEGAMPPIDAAAMAALPLADGEPDRDASKATHVRVPVGRPLPGLPALPVWLAHPRENLRDPRLVLSGLIGLGLVLLVLSLLLGGGPGGLVAAGASPSAPAVVATSPPPAGSASVDVTGRLGGTHQLVGSTGSGRAAGSRIDATWSSSTGAELGLSGAASAGTRTTDATFVLTLTVLVYGVPVTFTSDSGECTVGMAVQPKAVTGSFVCKKLRSDDGEQVVDARGTYRT